MKVTLFTLLLLLSIVLGVAVRLYALDVHYLNVDEEFYVVAAQKYHAGSAYDVRLFNYENPPAGKFLMSLPLGFASGVDYTIASALGPNLYVWTYLTYESTAQVYPLARLVSAVFGILTVLLVYLIGKEVFDAQVGLVAAAIASLSIDYIILSRTILLDIYLFFFIAASLFCYIAYKKQNNNLYYLGGFFVSFLLLLSTKNFQSLIILPPIIYMEIVTNKKKRVVDTIAFMLVLAAAYFLFVSFIYPPEISSQAAQTLGLRSVTDVFDARPGSFLVALLTIDSVAFLGGLMLTAGYFGAALHRRRDVRATLSRHLTTPSLLSFLLMVSLFSLAVLATTRLSINPKYITQASIPLFVLIGYVVVQLGNKKLVRPLLAGLLLVSMMAVIVYFPYYDAYPPYQMTGFSYIPRATVEPKLEYLQENGNPPIITNDFNLLLFYPGQKFAVPPSNTDVCSPDLLAFLQQEQIIGIVKAGETEKQFLCSHVFEYAGIAPQSESLNTGGTVVVVY